MKLIEKLSPYLPYGLNGIMYENIEELSGINVGGDLYTMDSDGEWSNFKPILRPLSDLTKEIECEGEKFVPSDYWDENVNNKMIEPELKNMAIHNYCDTYLYYGVQAQLIKWHFDVFGMIESSEAIDINTLEK